MTYSKRAKERFILAALLVVLVVGVAVVISHHKTRQTIHVTATSKKAKAAAANSQTSDKQTAPSTGFTPPSSAKSSPAATLSAPSGTFVSNHQPSLSGSSAPSTEQSVCNTVAGATCYIEFTKDNVIKQLPTQTADSSGAAYWTWNVNQAGLTAGKWQIAAVAALNGQTKTSQDSLELTVQP